MREPAIPDSELPDELPERFVGGKRMEVHYNYGRDGGGGIYTWLGKDGRAWPIQEQYDTRRPKPATERKPAFEPSKTGVVIRDASQPDGFYGEVCSTYRELRETWKRWRAERKAHAATDGVPTHRAPFACKSCQWRGEASECTGDGPEYCPDCGGPVVPSGVQGGGNG